MFIVLVKMKQRNKVFYDLAPHHSKILKGDLIAEVCVRMNKSDEHRS